MRAMPLFVLIAFLAATASAQAPKQKPVVKQPASSAATASYIIGYQIGANFKRQHVPIDGQAIIKGLQEGLAGGKPPMTEEQMDEVMRAFQKEVTARMSEQGKQEGEAFLATNAKAPGVKTTKSGLQYKVLKEGTGKSPQKSDTVTTHYKGTLIDGTPFDSSYDRNEPASFQVDGVIGGWTEALQMMKVGSKWQLFIPSDLAYGPQGSPPTIPPNSTLIFEVELLKIGQ
ncbi:MAG TPA: FKBP-type peptidyl-prolyl cis-trans isomerase [Pirellulales bacterium]|jgi:FKBP-type peptidyl-prolyl cis-trans isomerase FklB